MNKMLKSALALGLGVVLSTPVSANVLAEPGEWHMHHEMWISASEQGEYELKESGEITRCRTEGAIAKEEAVLRDKNAVPADGVFGKCQVTHLDQDSDHVTREMVCKKVDEPDRVFKTEATRQTLHEEVQGGSKWMDLFFVKLVELDQFVGPCSGQAPPLK